MSSGRIADDLAGEGALRTQMISDYRALAEDARQRGFPVFERAWTDSADRLEDGHPIDDFLDPGVDEPDGPEHDPNQLTFEFDL